jgi:hypothetical protein
MRDDARWEVDGEAHFMQVIAQLPEQRLLRGRGNKNPSAGKESRERKKRRR